MSSSAISYLETEPSLLKLCSMNAFVVYSMDRLIKINLEDEAPQEYNCIY